MFGAAGEVKPGPVCGLCGLCGEDVVLFVLPGLRQSAVRLGRLAFASDEKGRSWLERPVPKLEGKRPLDLIMEGRAEVITGMLYALNSGMSL